MIDPDEFPELPDVEIPDLDGDEDEPAFDGGVDILDEAVEQIATGNPEAERPEAGTVPDNPGEE